MYDQIIEYLNHNGVTLLAVSKTKPTQDIISFYDKGQRDFGENKIQELVQKEEELPKDIRWHFIGHLQRNKVKHIVPFIYLIHSIDSLRVLEKVNLEAGKISRVVNVLLQVKISDEITKQGWEYSDIVKQLDLIKNMEHICIKGFMGMAKNTDNNDEIRSEFIEINQYYQKFSKLLNRATFTELSIGMSSDYMIAIEQGSTMVRIGSLLFGNRG